MTQPRGPQDYSDELEQQQVYVDFGALRIPYVEGMELIPAVDDQQRIHSISIIVASRVVELTLFAAPRSGGVWEQSFEALKQDGQRRGFTPFPLTGPWGKELLLRPAADSEEMAQRFVGIEGRGWLLRATFFGAAAEDDSVRQPLDAIIANILVQRGSGPRVPGEIIYLTAFEALEQAMRDNAEHNN